MIDCNEWKTEKCYKYTNTGNVIDSNYDDNCMSHHFWFGT